MSDLIKQAEQSCINIAKLKERFDPKERYEIMALLDECGQVPNTYKCSDEEAFRKEGEALL